MRGRLCLILLCVIGVSGAATAEVSVEQYLQAKAKGGALFEQYRLYLHGVGVGVSWLQAAIDDKAQWYCPPDRFAPTDHDHLSILDLFLQEGNTLPSIPVEAALVQALKARFPCPAGTRGKR